MYWCRIAYDPASLPQLIAAVSMSAKPLAVHFNQIFVLFNVCVDWFGP